ncbi:cobalamin biosynthesis protein [Gymnodinialimonas hymeniacidonis]|uniref:cobalamin biosynthesis protein n=1 Tax=Gymnodinialimonas hymeniacidonis TaxID=3126508 RepID=UPI0034C5F88D
MERGAMIVAGFGFRGAATAESLANAYAKAGEAAFAATVSDKVSGVFSDFAASNGLTVLDILPEQLVLQETATQSFTSLAERGTGSVAEAAALAGAGEGSHLIRTRVISDDGCATCALAEKTE